MSRIGNKKPTILVIQPQNSGGQVDQATLNRYLTPKNKRRLEGFANVKIGAVTPDTLHDVDVILSLNGIGAEQITASTLKTSNTLKHVVVAHHWYIHSDKVKPACDIAGIRFIDASYAIDNAVAAAIVTAMFQARMGFYRHNHALQVNPGKAWDDANRSSGRTILSATVGLVSLGNIGKKVAKILRDIDALHPEQVLTYSRSLNDKAASELNVEKVDLDHLLRESDIISLHTRITPETEGMIGAREFALMKSDAVFINMARGPLVVEEALIEKLTNNPQFIAILDVFAVEPLTQPRHPLYSLPNTFVTPHVAAYNNDLLEFTTSNAIAEIERLFSQKV